MRCVQSLDYTFSYLLLLTCDMSQYIKILQQPNKRRKMLVNKMNLSQLQAEVIDNASLLEYVGGFDILSEYNEEQLKEKITNWIIEGDECTFKN